MQIVRQLKIFSILLPLTGCTAFQTYTELHKGRVALLAGMPETAVVHFNQVTELDANLSYSPLQESAWTYLGRAYYDEKKYPEARQALERAVAVDSEDSFARLHLGLTLARQGSHESGQKEVLVGLTGLHNRLDDLAYNTSTGAYWDPWGQLRAELEATRSGVQATNPKLDPLFARLESLAVTIEREIDVASRDESRERNRRAGGGD